MSATLASLDFSEFKQRVSQSGISLRLGPFNVRLKSSVDNVLSNFYQLYQYFPLLSDDKFVDFHINIRPPKGLRRYVKPQVNFYFDEYRPFKPLPYDQAMAFFEWGLNWAIAQHAQQYFIVHAAVVEKNGITVIMPGVPGAGKSTLCAGLVHHGWRLFSDEQALINFDATSVEPLARPINLKNQSIDVIKNFCPTAKFGDRFIDTSKGDISHVLPPRESVELIAKSARPSHIIFPKFNGQKLQAELTEVAKGDAFMEIVNHSFNYSVLGEQGFKTLTRLVDDCQTASFEYSDLAQALDVFNELTP